MKSLSVAFAAIEARDRFGSRRCQWCRRLGIVETSNTTRLNDGVHAFFILHGNGIWEEQSKQLPAAEGMLDNFHLLEHVAQTVRVLFGEGLFVSF